MNTLEVAKKYPNAFAALPECYQADDCLVFWEADGYLWARPREDQKVVLGSWIVRIQMVCREATHSYRIEKGEPMGTVVKVGQVWISNHNGDRVRIVRIEHRMAYVDYLDEPKKGIGIFFGDLTTSNETNVNWFRWQLIDKSEEAGGRQQSVSCSDPGGCYCAMCGNFFPYAVANRSSGKMVCWSCRQGWIPNGI